MESEIPSWNWATMHWEKEPTKSLSKAALTVTSEANFAITRNVRYALTSFEVQ